MTGKANDLTTLCNFANSLEYGVRNDLLNSGDEKEEDIKLKECDNHRVQKIVDYYNSWDIRGRILKISDKLYQVKIPKINLNLNSSQFDLLEVLDFSKPFLKQFSNAKLEVLKKSFNKSLKPSSNKFPSNFVPLSNSKMSGIVHKKPTIDFKPFFKSKQPSSTPVNNVNVIYNEVPNKGNKMKQLLQIVKKHVDTDPQKEQQIKEKNELDAMFNDIFADD